MDEVDFSNLPDEVTIILSDQQRTRELAYVIANAIGLDRDGAEELHAEMLAAIIGASEMSGVSGVR